MQSSTHHNNIQKFLAFAPATEGADPSDLSHFFQKYPRFVNSSFRFMKSLPKKLNSAYYVWLMTSILRKFKQKNREEFDKPIIF